MTIVNIEIRPSRAIIVCDTQYSDATTWLPTTHGQKVFTVPHLGVMLSCVGLPAGVLSVWSRLIQGAHPADMHELAAWAGDVIRDAPTAGRPHPDGTVSSLVAYCPRRNRMIGYRYSSNDGCEPVPIPDGLHIAPPVPGLELDGMSWPQIALAQRDLDIGIAPGENDSHNIGGVLMLYELTAPSGSPVIVSRALGFIAPLDRLATAAA